MEERGGGGPDQISTLVHIREGEVFVLSTWRAVLMPKLQKQERNSNNCALFAAFMLDICLNNSITDAVYVSSSDQRSWLSEVGVF